jgi:hypothetical protein
MKLFDKTKESLTKKNKTPRENSMTLNHLSRILIEEYKCGLEQEIIDELKNCYMIYDYAEEKGNMKLFLMVLNDEIGNLNYGMRDSVAEYAIAIRIAQEYDAIMPLPNKNEEQVSFSRYAIIKYDTIASMHPNYRAMGGKMSLKKFNSLIEKVHNDIS